MVNKSSEYDLVTKLQKRAAQSDVRAASALKELNLFRITIAKALGTLNSATIPSIKELETEVWRLRYLVTQLHDDLPQNRDWLDPILETSMKEIALRPML